MGISVSRHDHGTCVTVYFPPGAPARGIVAWFDREIDPPDFGKLDPPSKLLEVFKAKYEPAVPQIKQAYFVSLNWWEDHVDEVDAYWAQREIDKMRLFISNLQHRYLKEKEVVA